MTGLVRKVSQNYLQEEESLPLGVSKSQGRPNTAASRQNSTPTSSFRSNRSLDASFSDSSDTWDDVNCPQTPMPTTATLQKPLATPRRTATPDASPLEGSARGRRSNKATLPPAFRASLSRSASGEKEISPKPNMVTPVIRSARRFQPRTDPNHLPPAFKNLQSPTTRSSSMARKSPVPRNSNPAKPSDNPEIPYFELSDDENAATEVPSTDNRSTANTERKKSFRNKSSNSLPPAFQAIQRNSTTTPDPSPLATKRSYLRRSSPCPETANRRAAIHSSVVAMTPPGTPMNSLHDREQPKPLQSPWARKLHAPDTSSNHSRETPLPIESDISQDSPKGDCDEPNTKDDVLLSPKSPWAQRKEKESMTKRMAKSPWPRKSTQDSTSVGTDGKPATLDNAEANSDQPEVNSRKSRKNPLETSATLDNSKKPVEVNTKSPWRRKTLDETNTATDSDPPTDKEKSPWRRDTPETSSATLDNVTQSAKVDTESSKSPWRRKRLDETNAATKLDQPTDKHARKSPWARKTLVDTSEVATLDESTLPIETDGSIVGPASRKPLKTNATATLDEANTVTNSDPPAATGKKGKSPWRRNTLETSTETLDSVAQAAKIDTESSKTKSPWRRKRLDESKTSSDQPAETDKKKYARESPWARKTLVDTSEVATLEDESTLPVETDGSRVGSKSPASRKPLKDNIAAKSSKPTIPVADDEESNSRSRKNPLTKKTKKNSQGITLAASTQPEQANENVVDSDARKNKSRWAKPTQEASKQPTGVGSNRGTSSLTNSRPNSRDSRETSPINAGVGVMRAVPTARVVKKVKGRWPPSIAKHSTVENATKQEDQARSAPTARSPTGPDNVVKERTGVLEKRRNSPTGSRVLDEDLRPSYRIMFKGGKLKSTKLGSAASEPPSSQIDSEDAVAPTTLTLSPSLRQESETNQESPTPVAWVTRASGPSREDSSTRFWRLKRIWEFAHQVVDDSEPDYVVPESKLAEALRSLLRVPVGLDSEGLQGEGQRKWKKIPKWCVHEVWDRRGEIVAEQVEQQLDEGELLDVLEADGHFPREVVEYANVDDTEEKPEAGNESSVNSERFPIARNAFGGSTPEMIPSLKLSLAKAMVVGGGSNKTIDPAGTKPKTSQNYGNSSLERKQRKAETNENSRERQTRMTTNIESTPLPKQSDDNSRNISHNTRSLEANRKSQESVLDSSQTSSEDGSPLANICNGERGVTEENDTPSKVHVDEEDKKHLFAPSNTNTFEGQPRTGGSREASDSNLADTTSTVRPGMGTKQGELNRTVNARECEALSATSSSAASPLQTSSSHSDVRSNSQYKEHPEDGALVVALSNREHQSSSAGSSGDVQKIENGKYFENLTTDPTQESTEDAVGPVSGSEVNPCQTSKQPTLDVLPDEEEKIHKAANEGGAGLCVGELPASNNSGIEEDALESSRYVDDAAPQEHSNEGFSGSGTQESSMPQEADRISQEPKLKRTTQDPSVGNKLGNPGRGMQNQNEVNKELQAGTNKSTGKWRKRLKQIEKEMNRLHQEKGDRARHETLYKQLAEKRAEYKTELERRSASSKEEPKSSVDWNTTRLEDDDDSPRKQTTNSEDLGFERESDPADRSGGGMVLANESESTRVSLEKHTTARDSTAPGKSRDDKILRKRLSKIEKEMKRMAKEKGGQIKSGKLYQQLLEKKAEYSAKLTKGYLRCRSLDESDEGQQSYRVESGGQRSIIHASKVESDGSPRNRSTRQASQPTSEDGAGPQSPPPNNAEANGSDAGKTEKTPRKRNHVLHSSYYPKKMKEAPVSKQSTNYDVKGSWGSPFDR